MCVARSKQSRGALCVDGFVETSVVRLPSGRSGSLPGLAGLLERSGSAPAQPLPLSNSGGWRGAFPLTRSVCARVLPSCSHSTAGRTEVREVKGA